MNYTPTLDTIRSKMRKGDGVGCLFAADEMAIALVALRGAESEIDRLRANVAALEARVKELESMLTPSGECSGCIAWQEQAEAKDVLVGRLENVVEAARAYLNASSRVYVESGQMTTPKARAKTALLAALADLDATR